MIEYKAGRLRKTEERSDEPSLLISGIGRAEAMAYRDTRGQAMTD
ncbi:hypothetical protein [Bradyrhizobium hereditatis]|nr:hypothetical protein [Bradyrhizobium hereditatis]